MRRWWPRRSGTWASSPRDRRATWFDPGSFWSGDYLPLRDGWTYGREVKVGQPGAGRVPSARDRWR
ncbi:hypothetical protein [Nocardioides sp. B-3]|uniref:hypothetical protein n=1 Tax=Nocardioides sp. B-3 TaxID=2895565 RepID=UPI0021528B71|nr:hypothetical protein [Nocardioides sp. B-3]UUZ61166.1 hypothetical protein LP418_11395 [Nocardioides sp. B-3]